jgi:hypothetical protein
VCILAPFEELSAARAISPDVQQLFQARHQGNFLRRKWTFGFPPTIAVEALSAGSALPESRPSANGRKTCLTAYAAFG